ncbi:MAG: acetyl-CoA carboxylase biotin carboxylase subunit [Chloroflexi bacterium]|nr:acetyl-CoA carboxylase biotin carboxylase subunit [Chloroflexota bacterium]
MNIRRVLVANRGEIALRIIRACQSLGIEAVAAVSEADRDSQPARLANRRVVVGPARPADSYLNVGALIGAALGTGCDALHPGYGFLSEKPELARACAENGLTFVGPDADSIQRMGNKLEARELARGMGVPTVPGSRRVRRAEEAVGVAEQIGYPVLFKAAGGGGGRGIKIVSDPSALARTFQTAAAEARGAFGDDSLYVEKYIANARHVEVQVLGDRFGLVVHLGERDCSVQRRYQKVVEEAPAEFVPETVREELRTAAAHFARTLHYQNAGTVEFIYDVDAQRFYFLEMNTRIQVEHPVTEMVTGLDLVQLQLKVADGQALPLSQDEVRLTGHAIECRITAEAAFEGFRPSPGVITDWMAPGGPYVRMDSHCYAGCVVPPYYDSLLGKLIVWGPDRGVALERLARALDTLRIGGIETTVPFLRGLVQHPDFRRGAITTRWLEERQPDELRAIDGAFPG